MKHMLTIGIMLFMLFGLSACNSDTRTLVLKKCTILGDESIMYARANYVKLFYHYNPKKFAATYQQVEKFDHVKHRNIINTYDMAVRKLKAKDATSEALLTACKDLAEFSKDLVDQAYPRAIAHKSKYDPLTNQFFIEINQIVKFDHKIGTFDEKTLSFKHMVKTYQAAVKSYVKTFGAEISKKDFKDSYAINHLIEHD